MNLRTLLAGLTRPSRFAVAALAWLCAGGTMCASTGDEPRAVPTFQCVGLYWRTPEGDATRECRVRYREAGSETWQAALPLWFDPHEHAPAPERSREYRGSIVGLKSGTSYEVELALASGAAQQLRFTTWSDQPKIARVVTLPEKIAGTYTIREGGSAAEGYVVYAPAPGRTVEIDGRGVDDVNVRVEASHVIVRGLVLRNARRHGIDLGAVSDVIIEHCDISGWGENIEDGFGRDFDSAIYHRTEDDAPRTLRRVVIQHNRLHHPRSNSNSWLQARPTNRNSRHPMGPQGITFVNGDGEIVIRHNRIYSDFEHMFNDAMGEFHNFGYTGFPGRDSDVYGNRVSHCWDDGLEIEGANMNVRVWANVIDWTFDGIGGAATALGPCYIFRNVYLHSRRGPGDSETALRGQYFLKLGSDPKRALTARGRMYVFHNTVLQPRDTNGKPAGAERGLYLTSKEKHQTNIVSRNNLLWLRDEKGAAVFDGQKSPENDFDHDLLNGSVSAAPGSEAHGIVATPVLGAPLDVRRAWSMTLQPGSPGHDAGVPLPNFNEGFAGAAPDIGAFEAGRGLSADFPAATSETTDTTTVASITVRPEVAFLAADRAERLDVYLPAGWTPEAKLPAMVWVHGGGWTGGDKAATRDRNVCHALAAAGYVSVSINYRLGAGAWPQNLEDVKNAVRYVRAHAAQLGVDPERIALGGGSAGGHLALMAAYTADAEKWEPAQPWPGVSSRVACVIDLYGITDVRAWLAAPAEQASAPRSRTNYAVFAAVGSAVPPDVSPLAHVTASSPPTLILHGRADRTVDAAQSVALAGALQTRGVPHELLLLDGVGHTFDFDGWNHRPLPQDVRPVVFGFLSRHLSRR